MQRLNDADSKSGGTWVGEYQDRKGVLPRDVPSDQIISR